MTKAGTEKTNRDEAGGIAQIMRLGWFRAVHVKDLEAQKLRTLLANRKLLKRKLIVLENHNRGSLRQYGLFIGQVGRGGSEARVRELAEDADFIFAKLIETMLEVRGAVLAGLQQPAHDPPAGDATRAGLASLQTVPGVGPVVAQAFRSARTTRYGSRDLARWGRTSG